MSLEISDILTEYIENENVLGKVADVDEVLCKLVDANKMHETKLRRVVCCIDDLLKGHNKWQMKFGKKVFHKLIALLNKDQGIPTNLAVHILVCIKLYIEKFPKEPGQYLIEELWCLSTNIEKQPHAPVILGQLFDLFVRHIDNFLYETQLQQVIQQLLSSPEKVQRKTAIYLMGLQTTAIENSKDAKAEVFLKASGWHDKQTYVQCWFTYMNIWKQLDGEVTPSIKNLEDLVKLRQLTSNNWQRIWFELLYIQLLAHDNLKITRMSIEHVLANYNFDELSLRLRKQFLLATNNVLLYDVNGDFLERKHIPNIVNDSRIEFLEVFITIDSWHLVPMHFWFSYFKKEDNRRLSISKDLLMRLAKFIRLQSYEIRKMMQSRFISNIFGTTIRSLSIPEYIAFTEALYDIDDGFHHTYEFEILLQRSQNTGSDLSHFSERFYKIFTSRIDNYEFDCYTGYDSQQFNNRFKALYRKLQNVPKEQHAWFRFLFVFNLVHSDLIVYFCRKCYDLDLLQLKIDGLSLTDFHRMIADKLVWNPVEEADRIHSKCVDLYTEFQLKKWSDMEKLSLDPLKLIAMGNLHTYTRLLTLLGEHDAPDVSQHILDSLLQILKEKYLRRTTICKLYIRHMHSYAEKHLSETEWKTLEYKILNLAVKHRDLTYEVVWRMKVSKELLIRGLLHGEPSQGAKRIEEAYEELLIHTIPINMSMIHCFKFKEYSHLDKSIFDELLRINNELSIKIPEYHENSKVHRLKIRIAQAIFAIYELNGWDYWSEELWTALMAEHNKANIRYLYELMIITFASNVEPILEKFRQIRSFTGSQKLSLLSVVYNYYMINSSTVKDEHLIEIIDLVTPLTMGANYLVRQHAQVIVYCLVKEMEHKKIENPGGYDELQKAAVEALGDERLNELLLHPRFKMHEYYKRSSACVNDMLLYVTNTPFDECGYWFMRNSFEWDFQNEFDEARKTYIRNMIKKPRTYIAAADDLNLDFGPYVIDPKPIDEILYNNGKHDNSEMLVVASLIDKLPNLTGIASTCETMGIKNIVISSKRHLENPSFKDLGIEQTLNFYEVRPDDLVSYLEKKKTEGYKILGAEQTANSVSFKDFQFPAKCVLLLGHEKHGIPAHLISILDHVVEIPQLGDVRSLNVHVTGALFMWEYCKQHTLPAEVQPEFISNFANMELNWWNLRAPNT